jgi:hypothetical protein
MQSNRLWIAGFWVMFYFVSHPVKAQESGTSNDPVWQRADELVKKLALDETSVHSLKVSIQCRSGWWWLH